MVVADCELGWSLLQAGRWQEASATFMDALREDPSPEAMSGLAQALWWAGDIQGSIEHHQRAYAAYQERRDWLAAAWSAIAVAISYKCCLGNEAAANGWLARAQTVASKGDPAPIQGWLWSLQGYLAMDRDLQQAEQLLSKAIEYSRRTSDRDLELIAIGDLGAVLIKSGRTEEGFRLIDEAMAGVSAGEHRRHDTVVFVCCIMLTACELTSDLTRAIQWSQVANRFIETYGCPFLYAECRALYGSILMARGAWTEAEREIVTAMKLTQGGYQMVFVLSAALLADLKHRQGQIEEAEQLLNGIEQELPAAFSLAAIKFARGEYQIARALLERVLRHRDEQHIESVRALEMLVSVHLAGNDRRAAGEVLARLQALAGIRLWPEAAARANMAAGRLAMAEQDQAAALGFFEQAMKLFSDQGLPYERARARLAIAEAASQTNRELAVAEARGALLTFDELGARYDSAAASGLLRRLGVPTRPGPKKPGLLTEREKEVLRLLSSGLSNPEIADRLVISRKTAAHHVSNVLSKLALRNRTEAAAYASRLADR